LREGQKKRKEIKEAFKRRAEAKEIVRQAWRMVTKRELLKIIDSMKV
jgi:hypothetical protein